MATDKLINSTQGDDIIGALNDIADNVGNITYGPQTSADKVVSMLGYAEAAEAASINPGDTLNVAIGKLEKKANDNATEIENKIDKLTNATAGDIATVTATGEIADSAVSIADSNTGLADSDTAVPTSKTVKTYVDSTATGISRYLGTITAASGLSTSAKKGDFYVVKTAWSGVHAGDEIIAEKDNPAQTIDGTNWSLLHNEADTDTKYTFATGDSNGTFKVTPSDTGTAQSVPIKGLGNAAYKGVATSVSTSEDLVTSKAVNTKLGDYVQNSDFVELAGLEAEDRASLAEVVDSGAKNLLQLPSSTGLSNGITFSCNPNTGIVTANGTKESGESYILLANISLANFSRKFVAYCNSTENTKVCITIVPHRTNGTYASTIAIGTYTVIDLTSSTFDSFLIRAVSYADTGTTLSNEQVYPMLCTKAAFGVSSKFVPYRPNWDLVVDTLDRKLNAKTELGSIDMNDVITNCRGTASITANAPVTGYCFVDVIAIGYDVKQQIQKLSSPSTYYIRHRRYQATSPYYSWTSWFKYEGTEVTS